VDGEKGESRVYMIFIGYPPMAKTLNHIKACYDEVARTYTEKFSDELSHKSLDRELLSRFATDVGNRGEVYDLGCGPGQTTRLLHDMGVPVRGLDLSSEMVSEARRKYPGITFEQGDMTAMPVAKESLAGVVAFYAIVHFTLVDLQRALTEIFRVLQSGGSLLIAFHIGEGLLHVDDFLGHAVSLDFVFFMTQNVTDELERAGFEVQEAIERDPYPGVEYPSRRAYLFARKPW
jgi:ubiquinone/menaquinone biosynthesis C-methylase UbiE